MNDKIKIYLAGPFFNDQECEVKARIKEHLEAMCALNESYEICDPQTDGNFESWEMTNPDWGDNTFCNDWASIDCCDMVVAVDWGLYGDCGTAWEIGYAFAMQKEVIVIAPMKSLTRPHSLMVANGCLNFMTEARFLTCKSFDDLRNSEYFAAGVEQK